MKIFLRLLFIYLMINPIRVAALQVTRLSCNYEREPIALDDTHPRLSWQLISSGQGAEQTAYQILVASSAQQLLKNKGDVWDSEKILSDQSLYVAYKGLALQSSKKYYWKVKIWDEHAKASAWSRTATWQMGLLSPADWKATWITASQWFTAPEFRPKGFQLSAKGGWADIDLGKPTPIELIKLFPLDSASFPVRFQILGSDEFNFVHHQLLVDQSLTDYHIKGMGGEVFPLKPASYRFIRLKISGNDEKRNTAVRQMEVFSGQKNVALMQFTREYNTGWQHGHSPFLVDGMPSEKEGKVCPAEACPTTAAPMFRKVFRSNKKIRQATLYFAALGMVDVTINGQKPGNDVLGPPFTDYYKRIMYSTYDITKLITTGENVIGAVLGNGFFSTPGLGFGQRQNGNGPPRFILQAIITYLDGTTKTVGTAADWKWSRSEITFNDIWAGYSEDRNLSKPGWDLPGYNDKEWGVVKAAAVLPGKLVSRSGPPNRVNGIIRPVSVKGDHAYFQTASVGWPLLKLNGHAGQTITITGTGPGYAMAKLTFTLAKDGPALLSPRFIIQPGPTDLKVEGLLTPLKTEDIAIQYINADLETSGAFTCSNPFLDTLFQVAMRTHRNYINDFPADPNREKQGWTQDAQNMFHTAAYFTDVRDLYWRWWNDMADNQDEQGYLGSVVPMVNRQVYDWNSPWWSGMLVFLPWEHYQYFGNSQILEKGYTAMRSYVDLLGRMAETGEGANWDDYTYFTQNLDTIAAKEKMIIWNGAGDWNNPYTKTQHAVPTPMTTMPAWYHYAQIVAKTAALLGKKEDALKYDAIAEGVKDSFNKKYYHAQTGLYGDSINSQTGQVLPLAVGMVPQGKSELTYQRLLDAIHARHDHVGTGFVSLDFMLKMLAGRRESAVANQMINKKDYPGWNTLTRGGVFQEEWAGGGAQMPSCGGAVGAWLFQSVLGIQPDPDHPGFKKFMLSPQPDKATGLISATGYYDCVYGRISINWKCADGKFIAYVEIPANTSARVYIPADDLASFTESGLAVRNNVNIQKAALTNGLINCELKAGKYHLETAYTLTN